MEISNSRGYRYPVDQDTEKILAKMRSLGLEIQTERCRSMLDFHDASRLLEKARIKGNCRYCGDKLPPAKRTVHSECVKAMCLMDGHGANMGHLIRRDACQTCGGSGQVMDHLVPLEVARLKAVLDGDIEGWIAAHKPSNVQWLCSDCNKRKTAIDAGVIAQERRRMKRVRLLGEPMI